MTIDRATTIQWCEVHNASVPIPADDWNKCYEWWIGEYNPDDPPLEQPCSIVSRWLVGYYDN